MEHFQRSIARVLALVFLSGAGSAHDGVHFELALESSEFPDLDAHPVIDGDVGSEHVFTANMVISISGIEQGVQGWSCGVRNVGVEIVSITVEGTVSAYESEGGLVDEGEFGGFIVYEVIDPSQPQNEGRSGVVQAVIPSLRKSTVLVPEASHIVGKNMYRAKVESTGRIAFIRYEDGLAGGGEPIPNNASCQGETVFPTLSHRQITIGQGAMPEDAKCQDTVDNDGDGWTDCGDPDCNGHPPCPAVEICGDGIDNDGDVLPDCDDPTCSAQLHCRKFERCSDGIDNNGDGKTDCEDPQCRGIPPCPIPEQCLDEVDNDGDGLADCDDLDCVDSPICRKPEDCDDGLDNNGDQRTDCEDPDCRGIPPCPPPEVCGDGIDNDGDLWTDCDDPECEYTGACRQREVCDDGLDNDNDGLTDCGDWDCKELPSCPAGEICGDAIDNDADGIVDCKDPDCAGAPSCTDGAGGFDLVLSAKGCTREGGKNVVQVDPGAEADVEAVTSVVPFPGPQPRGVQGWSVSVAHNKQVLTIESVTVEGTDAGLAMIGGFDATEIAGSGEGGGRDELPGLGGGNEGEGFISAVVLSFKKPLTLDPRTAQSIARSMYVLRDGLGDPLLGPAMVHFQDGLVASGQPVSNILTVNGESEMPLHRIPLEVRRTGSGAPFVRGDVNDDGKVNIADAVWSVNELVRQGPPARCRRTSDVNADTLHDLSDVVYLIAWEFLHGPQIPLPFPTCGVSYGPKSLECPEGSYSHCP